MPPSFLLQPVPPTSPPWTRELHWACSPHGDGTEDVHKYVSLPNDRLGMGTLLFLYTFFRPKQVKWQSSSLKDRQVSSTPLPHQAKTKV